MVKLPDPQTCKFCGARGLVVNSRIKDGFKERRRECPTCMVPLANGKRMKHHRWSTFETLINPRRIKQNPKFQPREHNI